MEDLHHCSCLSTGWVRLRSILNLFAAISDGISWTLMSAPLYDAGWLWLSLPLGWSFQQKKPPACSRFSRATVCTILPLSVILCVVCCSVLQVRVVHCFGNLCGFLLAHGLSIAEFRPRGLRTWHVPQLWHTDSDGQMRFWMWQLGSQSCCIIDEIWMPSGGRRGWADCWQVYIGQACTCVSLNLAVSKGHLSLSISIYIYLYLSPSIYIYPYLLISVHTYLYLSKSIHIY